MFLLSGFPDKKHNRFYATFGRRWPVFFDYMMASVADHEFFGGTK